MTRLLLIIFFAFGVVGAVDAQEKVNSDVRPSVLLFLSPDCPICQKYMGIVNGFVEDFSNEITFRGIVPGNARRRDIKDFIKEYNISFPLQSDKGNFFVQQFKPNVTPEVVLLDQEGIVRYQGAIDNWFYELGKNRPKPTERYLLDGIHAVLSGKDPERKRTEAIGCIINADLKGMNKDTVPTHHQH